MNFKKNIRTFCFLLFVVLMTSCSADSSSHPKATIENMLSLAQSGEWYEYVDKYYGEQNKFVSDADKQKVVDRFQHRWGERVITILEQAASVEAQISDDGSQAIFELSEGSFTLYKNEAGNWTFRL